MQSLLNYEVRGKFGKLGEIWTGLTGLTGFTQGECPEPLLRHLHFSPSQKSGVSLESQYGEIWTGLTGFTGLMQNL